MDHRTIPGITWAPAPGPLRDGDYIRMLSGNVYVAGVDCAAVERIDVAFRVVPVVAPLETPEECEPESLETHEVGTFEADLPTLGERILFREGADRFGFVGSDRRMMFPANTRRDLASCVRWVATGRSGRIFWGRK